MSFPVYESYKDSGQDWIGQVPRHWDVMPLKRDLLFLTSGSRGWADHYSDEGALFIRIGNLTRDSIKLDQTDIQRVAVPDGAEGERTRVRPGDVLFSITAYLGSVAVVPDDIETAYVSQHVALARLRRLRLNPKWAAYVALSHIGKTYLEMQGYGGTKIQLSLDDVAGMFMTVPPAHEQQAIAEFLDRETAKIDDLVAEQQRLIKLLQEKRQAVISHAVTKGLDPAAPMKDSGVEWLGEVPAHWEVKRLKHITPQLTVGIVVEPSKYYTDEGVPALRSLNVRQGRIEQDNFVFISPEANELHSKSRLIAGDLVAVRTGQPGTTAVIPQDLDGCNCIDLIIIRQPERGSSHYLCWYLASEAAVRQFTEGSGGAIQQHFNVSTAADLIVAWPPSVEQPVISQFLDEESQKIDLLMAEAGSAITLLQERRAALISAAVTGKIDVRDVAIAAAEAA